MSTSDVLNLLDFLPDRVTLAVFCTQCWNLNEVDPLDVFDANRTPNCDNCQADLGDLTKPQPEPKDEDT